jgi:hypothetical protein
MSQRPLSVAVIGARMADRRHAAGYRQVSTVFGEGLPPVRQAANAMVADGLHTMRIVQAVVQSAQSDGAAVEIPPS